MADISLELLIFSVLALPGVVFHELGHYVFCRLAGVRVHRVVYFQFASPAGYVVHATPKHFRDHFAIVVGPFILNSITAYLLYGSVVGKWARPAVTASHIQPQTLLLWSAAIWLGASVALQAFPSRTDAYSLWQATNRHLRRANILAIVGYPVVGIIYLANILKKLWLHWLYAAALIWLAASLSL